MSGTFPALVGEAVEIFYGHLTEEDDETRHARDPKRIEEAGVVAPLADAIADAEVFRTHAAKGLGIYGMNMIPPVGDQIAKRLRDADAAEREQALEAVRAALAVGYVGFISVEVPSGVTLRDDVGLSWIWNLTVRNFRGDGPERLGLPKNVIEAVDGVGQAFLIERLKAAGLLGMRKTKVGFTGRYYARAGLFLRAGQTTHITENGLGAVDKLLPDLWPYAEYVRAA